MKNGKQKTMFKVIPLSKYAVKNVAEFMTRLRSRSTARRDFETHLEDSQSKLVAIEFSIERSSENGLIDETGFRSSLAEAQANFDYCAERGFEGFKTDLGFSNAVYLEARLRNLVSSLGRQMIWSDSKQVVKV